MKRNRIYPLTLWLFFIVLVIDQTSKYWTYQSLPVMDYFYYEYPYGGIGLFKNFLGIEFSLSHATNTGAAWGMLGSHPFFLIVLRLFLIAGLFFYILFYNRHRSWQPFLALILAGAIGNVIDFFLYGHVVDMLHVVLWGYDFPVFNVADSAISIGVFSLFILTLFDIRKA